jgi:hypothetical protein
LILRNVEKPVAQDLVAEISNRQNVVGHQFSVKYISFVDPKKCPNFACFAS